MFFISLFSNLLETIHVQLSYKRGIVIGLKVDRQDFSELSKVIYYERVTLSVPIEEILIPLV
jgi:hypothetical protein